jgi:urease gamma subunit
MCHHVPSRFVRQCNTSQKSILFRDFEVVFGKKNLFFGVTTATEVSPAWLWSHKTILFLTKVAERALSFSHSHSSDNAATMRLSPREYEKVTLHQVIYGINPIISAADHFHGQLGFLAQSRLARGLRLNQAEATALISSQLQERIRDGVHSVADLMQHGKNLLGRRHVLPSVPALLHEIQVEGTFYDGYTRFYDSPL